MSKRIDRLAWSGSLMFCLLATGAFGAPAERAEMFADAATLDVAAPNCWDPFQQNRHTCCITEYNGGDGDVSCSQDNPNLDFESFGQLYTQSGHNLHACLDWQCNPTCAALGATFIDDHGFERPNMPWNRIQLSCACEELLPDLVDPDPTNPLHCAQPLCPGELRNVDGQCLCPHDDSVADDLERNCERCDCVLPDYAWNSVRRKCVDLCPNGTGTPGCPGEGYFDPPPPDPPACVQVLVDASRDEGNWWDPQQTGFYLPQPHGGKALADYLRSRRSYVDELPPAASVTSEVLAEFDVVLRASGCGPYTDDEISAYADFVDQGGSLLLVATETCGGCLPDALAESFGLTFSGCVSGEVTDFAQHPITEGLTLLNYVNGSFVPMPPGGTATLGTLSGQAVLGEIRRGSGRIVFFGDLSGLEAVPERLAANLMTYFRAVALNQIPTLECLISTPGNTPGTCHASVDCSAVASCADPDQDLVDVVCDLAGDFPVGDTTVEVSCSDELSSIDSSCIVRVEDVEAPTLECPANRTLECPSENEFSAGPPEVADNCALATVGYADAYEAGCGAARTITRTWTAVDESGNSTDCEQTIEIVDSTPPGLRVPRALEMTCGEATTPASAQRSCSLPSSHPRIAQWLSSARAADSCGEVTISDDAPPTLGIGTTVVTFEATDACGNLTRATSKLSLVRAAAADEENDDDTELDDND